MEQSVEIPSKYLKRLVAVYTSPIFQIFFQKKDFSENPVNLDVGI